MSGSLVEARAAELAAARGCPPDCPACWAKAEWLVGATPAAPSRDSCVNGHQWTDATSYWRPDGYRVCRPCRNDSQKRNQSRKQGFAPPLRSPTPPDSSDALRSPSSGLSEQPGPTNQPHQHEGAA